MLAPLPDLTLRRLRGRPPHPLALVPSRAPSGSSGTPRTFTARPGRFHTRRSWTGSGWWGLGIVIDDPQLWSGGHGTRALRLWTAATFADTGAPVLPLTTWSGNARMLRAAQRCGDRECAQIPEVRRWQGRRHDSVKRAALRRDWPRASAGCENAGL